MPDANTLAVLRDVVYIALVAAFVGAWAYSALRRAIPVTAWNTAGRTITNCYDRIDALAALLLVLLLTSSLLFAGAAAAESKGKEATKITDMEQLNSVGQTIMMDLMLVAVVVVFLRVWRDRDPAELFGLRRMSIVQALIKAAWWFVPIYAIVWCVSVGSEAMLNGVWPDMGHQSAVEVLENTSSPVLKLALSLTAVVVAPLAEEIMFRGFIYGVIKRYTDGYLAAIVSALLFAAIHMHVGIFLPLFALGLLFAAAYETTGCLFVSIFLHALFNGAQELNLFFGPKS